MPYFDAKGTEIAITADSPEVKALLDSAVTTATQGLVGNRDMILEEKKALQSKMDAEGEKWKGLDAKVVRNIMSRMEDDEETRLLAEGKIDAVFEKKTERLSADHKKQLALFEDKVNTLTKTSEAAQNQVKKLKVESSIRQSATSLGVVPTAVEDALMRAMQVFQINERGDLTAEKDGVTIFGVDGKSPITPNEWLDSMKETVPHWFPASTGGGIAGSTATRGAGHTITKTEALDHKTYVAAKEAATKSGSQLTIVE